VKPFLLVLSAPSGGGKSSIARNLLQGRDDLGYSVSATTRPMREGERDGVDYHFLSREEFVRRRAAGEFLETATYGGHLYGTLRSEIERLFAAGRHAVLDIEIEGARQIRASFPNSLHVFVLPPSAEVLIGRLKGRNTEPPEMVRERITRAADELAAVAEYDYALVNQDLVVAVAQVAAILDAEARRVSRQDDLPKFIARLRQDVVRQSLRHAGDEMGGGRRHDDEIGLLRQPHVRERPAWLPEGGQHRAPGERLERDGPDELGGAPGEHDVHPGPRLNQTPGEKAALVAGDPARHAENDAAAGPHHQASERRRRTSL